MIYYAVMLLVAVLGIMFLVKGEAKITKTKVVKGTLGKVIGGILLAAVVVDVIGVFTMNSFWYISVIALIIAFVIGLVKGKPA